MAKPKIFVSHSTLDMPLASRIVDDLNAAGAQAWMDTIDLGAGNFQQRISEALADCDWFLLVLTPNALASNWVRQEVDAANLLRNQGQLENLIFIKAADMELSELPVLWRVFNIFDTTVDYATALDRTRKAVGLTSTEQNPHPRSSTPEDIRDRIRRGRLLLANENYAEALEIFEAILAEDPSNYGAAAGKVRALSGLGKLDEANESFRKARMYPQGQSE